MSEEGIEVTEDDRRLRVFDPVQGCVVIHRGHERKGAGSSDEIVAV